MSSEHASWLDLRIATTFVHPVMLGILLSSCSEATPPMEEAVSVCHISGPAGVLLDVDASEVLEHRGHGDYVARLLVSRQASPRDDGIHFARITDALASARDGRLLPRRSVLTHSWAAHQTASVSQCWERWPRVFLIPL